MRSSVCFLLFLFAAITPAFARNVTGDDWASLEKRVAEARKDYLKTEKSLLSKGGMEDELAAEAVAYLRGLLLYESATRLLLNPTDEARDLQSIREFSTQERRNIQKLRQEIRDADRERLLEGLNQEFLFGDEDAAETILKDELRLDRYFKSNTNKLTSQISRKERALDKLIGKTDRDDPQQITIRAEIEELKEQVSAIHEVIFGFRYGCGFREPMDESLTGAGATLLRNLIAERERIFGFLKGEHPEGGEGEGKTGTVGGSFLYSANLGVVLDVSGSMTPYLEDLRDEIDSYFEAPRFREIEGCRLNECHFESSRATRRTTTWATMSVIEELITVRDVDTVYWFSDLKDEQSAVSIRRLRELLMRGGTRFHVKSLSRSPSRTLEPIITDFQD